MQPNDPFSSQPQTPPTTPPTQQPQQPYPQPPLGQTPQQVSAPLQPTEPEPAKKKHRTLALWLLIGPSALFVVALIVAISSPMLFPDLPPAEGELFGETPAGRTLANMFVFLSGAIVVLTWLPGIIIGSILLARK